MLKNLLNGVTEEDAAVIAECLFLKHPNAVTNLKPLSKTRLKLYNLICEGHNTVEAMAEATDLRQTNIWTQLKYLLDDGYIQKVSRDDHPTTYRASTTDEIIGEE